MLTQVEALVKNPDFRENPFALILFQHLAKNLQESLLFRPATSASPITYQLPMVSLDDEWSRLVPQRRRAWIISRLADFARRFQLVHLDFKKIEEEFVDLRCLM